MDYIQLTSREINFDICKLHGEEDAKHFKEQWVPLMYEVVNNIMIFNWGSILLINVAYLVYKCTDSTPICFKDFTWTFNLYIFFVDSIFF